MSQFFVNIFTLYLNFMQISNIFTLYLEKSSATAQRQNSAYCPLR